MAEAHSETQRLEAAKELRDAFDRREAWRDDRLTEIDDGLEHHWADTVLSAVREGDPLAYGTDRLRQARSTYARDLRRVEGDQGPERRGFGRHEGDISRGRERPAGALGQAELSSMVSELNEAIEGCIPSPVELTIPSRSIQTRSAELGRLQRPMPPDQGIDLGLGR
jgi:hypothetical protein